MTVVERLLRRLRPQPQWRRDFKFWQVEYTLPGFKSLQIVYRAKGTDVFAYRRVSSPNPLDLDWLKRWSIQTYYSYDDLMFAVDVQRDDAARGITLIRMPRADLEPQ